MQPHSPRRRSKFCLLLLATYCAGAAERPYTVTDSIELVRPLSSDAARDPEEGSLSPNGHWSVFVLRQGNLQTGTTTYSLAVFDTREVLAHLRDPRTKRPEHQLLTQFETASFMHGIETEQWLPQGEQILFLGRRKETRDVGQLYLYDLPSRSLRQLTHQPHDIVFAVLSQNTEVILYATATPRDWETAHRRGYLVQGRQIGDVVSRNASDAFPAFRYSSLNLRTGKEVALDLELAELWPRYPIVSPSGRWALLTTSVTRYPAEWREYEMIMQLAYPQGPPKLEPRHGWINATEEFDGPAGPVAQIQLLDLSSGSVRPLLNAPARSMGPRPTDVTWGADEKSVQIERAYLPLADTRGAERDRRKRTEAAIEIRLDTGESRFADPAPPQAEPEPTAPPHIVLRRLEDRTRPPEIEALVPGTDLRRTLTAFNVAAGARAKTHMELFEWTDRFGQPHRDALMHPDGARPDEKLPVVIQTYGTFDDEIFFEMVIKSGFAARPLASRGIRVAQTNCTGGYALYSPLYGENAAFTMCLEDLVNALESRGFIDRQRVGVMGYSRSGFNVHYAVTFSKDTFAAALIADSYQATPWNYVLSFGALRMMQHADAPGREGQTEAPSVIGAPFFGKGIELWEKRSPFFHLDRIRTPLRYQVHESHGVPGNWDTYAILKRMRRPIEFLHIPRDGHNLSTPLGRYASQQGSVDWFAFWLKGDEDPDPSKAAQYERWRILRDQQADQLAEEIRASASASGRR